MGLGLKRIALRLFRKELSFDKIDLNVLSELNCNLNAKHLFEQLVFSKSLNSDFRCYIKDVFRTTEDVAKADIFLGWGANATTAKSYTLAVRYQKPFVLIEDGFIRSIHTWCAKAPINMIAGLSFCLDTKAFYYDGSRTSDLENLLNNYDVSEKELSEASKTIEKIVRNNVSKYNNQPLVWDEQLCPNKERVLIIDQSYGDQSLKYGLVDDTVFENMIADAIRENPDSEILFKVHPDTIARGKESHFLKMLPSSVKIFDSYVNPLVLLKSVDKVYVATSQLGFEALLCGKEVHVYGMPFYAGWGLTVDKVKCSRRYRKRTLEEIFYIAYMKYCYYTLPHSKKLCSINEVIDYLIESRNQYLDRDFI